MARRLLALFLFAACAPAGAPPPAADDDPILAFRRRLADPAAHRLRDGMKIDEPGMLAALKAARAEHGDRITRRWDADLRALGESTAPSEPAYRTVLTIHNPTGAREAEVIHQLTDRSVHDTLRRYLGMYLAMTMSRDLGMPIAEAGRWLAYLAIAEPTISRCGPDLCMAYGDPDIFVFTLGTHDGAPLVDSVRWYQRPTATTPAPAPLPAPPT
jgi:hypothetical protein